jgi:hypothetical protein
MQFPKRIIVPTDFLPLDDVEQQAMVESFIRAVESFLGVKRIELSFRERWQRSPPEEAEGQCLDEYLKMVHHPFSISWSYF